MILISETLSELLVGFLYFFFLFEQEVFYLASVCIFPSAVVTLH